MDDSWATPHPGPPPGTTLLSSGDETLSGGVPAFSFEAKPTHLGKVVLGSQCLPAGASENLMLAT